mmetsp:Transcript_4000/g.13201  ORF Transcript_4000/g.13201 Transcript_4000/m.13201 type:complete len:248 (-) Transcript_4000:689-1432(-)
MDGRSVSDELGHRNRPRALLVAFYRFSSFFTRGGFCQVPNAHDGICKAASDVLHVSCCIGAAQQTMGVGERKEAHCRQRFRRELDAKAQVFKRRDVRVVIERRKRHLALGNIWWVFEHGNRVLSIRGLFTIFIHVIFRTFLSAIGRIVILLLLFRLFSLFARLGRRRLFLFFCFSLVLSQALNFQARIYQTPTTFDGVELALRLGCAAGDDNRAVALVFKRTRLALFNLDAQVGVQHAQHRHQVLRM